MNDAKSDRPTREQIDAVPHKAAALLLAAARPDPTLRTAARQVQDALIALDDEVRALRSEQAAALAALNADGPLVSAAKFVREAADAFAAARTPQPSACVCVGDTCEMSGCDVPSCREPEGDFPAWRDADAPLPSVPDGSVTLDELSQPDPSLALVTDRDAALARMVDAAARWPEGSDAYVVPVPLGWLRALSVPAVPDGEREYAGRWRSRLPEAPALLRAVAAEIEQERPMSAVTLGLVADDVVEALRAVPDGEDATAICPLCHRRAALVLDAHGHFGPDIEAEDEVMCDVSHWRLSWAAEKAAGGRPDTRSSLPVLDGEDVPAPLDAAFDVRPGMCPTCSSAQPHLHPTSDLCPDAWHEPTPATSSEWRAEMSRWAGLVEQIADGVAGVTALRRVVAGMRRQSAAAALARPTGGEQ